MWSEALIYYVSTDYNGFCISFTSLAFSQPRCQHSRSIFFFSSTERNQRSRFFHYGNALSTTEEKMRGKNFCSGNSIQQCSSVSECWESLWLLLLLLGESMLIGMRMGIQYCTHYFIDIVKDTSKNVWNYFLSNYFGILLF